MDMTPLLIRGMWGLGDNIYLRPFIRAAATRASVYLETPWPELFEDLPVRFVRGDRALRTQTENVKRQAATRWSNPPKGAREIRIGYGHVDLVTRGILGTMERQLPLNGTPLVMDLPPLVRSPVRSKKPIAFVRPVTVRSEWRNEARNSLPEYVAQLAEALRQTHFVVGVAHLKDGQEWLAGEQPPFDRAFLHGELDVSSMLALAREADVIMGGVGFIVPAALALQRKAFIVYGGHGAHNAPAVITDRRIDCSQIGFAIPERFCQCANMLHKCDKRIASLPRQWNDWTRRVGLQCSIGSRNAA